MADDERDQHRSSDRHHKKKKRHKKKHHHKKHHKKHRRKSDADQEEPAIDDQKLFQALATLDDQLLNATTTTDDSEPETATKDESTGQSCSIGAAIQAEQDIETRLTSSEPLHKDHSESKKHAKSKKRHSKSKQKHRSRSKSNDSRSRRRHSRSRSGDYKSRRHHSRSKSNDSRSRRRHSRSRSGDYKSRRHHSRSKSNDSRSRRRHSRSRSRDHRSRRHRSRSRSGDFRRRRHSRSRSRDHKSRRHRSRSRSGDYRRRRHSRSRKRYHRSRHYSSSSNSENGQSEPTNQNIPVIVTAAKIKENKIAQFTSYCRQLSELEKDGSDHTAIAPVQHPFKLNTDSNERSSQQLPSDREMVGAIMEQLKPVEEKFPVSSGLDHMKESIATVPTVNEPVNQLVVQRVMLQKQLQSNSEDQQTILALADIERKLANWSQGKVKRGVFTGGKEISPMPKWEHDKGYQAWAKKNMFKGLAPVMGGFGMRMLMKMGWEMGKPLGKRGEGHIEPIQVEVKIDRHGLVAAEDKAGGVAPFLPANIPAVTGQSSLAGKHPVSALQELCSKKSYTAPEYLLLSETGPSHMKSFMYKVVIPELGSYQPVCSCNSKKLAKAQAAIACLKAVGLMDSNK